ncbi:MAG: VgrG-related protein [Micromonosporaceae bacterium]|nr:VgrG-related protein [Micromonosporaceae bacterium]
MATNESFANTLLVEVEGRPLPTDIAALLSYAYVDDSRIVPDMFVLRFRDPQRFVLAKTSIRIGTKVSLRVQTADAGAPCSLMTGEVTAVELELDRTGTVTQVRGMDLAHRLFRGRRVAAYPDMTVADIVRKIAGRAGLKIGTIDVPATAGGQRHTQISQDNVSDGEFLTRLADLVGAHLAVIDGSVDFRMPARPAGAPSTTAKATSDPLVLEADRNLVSLRVGITAAEQAGEVEARGWSFEQKQAVTATAMPRAAEADNPEADPAKLVAAFQAPPLLVADSSWRTPGMVKAAAQSLASHVGGGCVELEGVAKGNPRLRAGTAVALANVGEPFAGKYTLTTTRHLFSEQAGYTTAFTVSGRQERSLYGTVIGGTAGGAAGGATGSGIRAGGDGLVPAIVSDVRDPLTLGRVKLKLPWLSDAFTTGWARVVQAGAGRDRGMVILPEVGDEVLVGFGCGDLDAPYVLGGLHNGRDPLPALEKALVDGGNGAITVRAFVSRTGHRIEMVEDGGILIRTGDGKLSVRLDQTKGTVEVKGSDGITVDAGSGTLTLKGAQVAMSASGDVTVRGAQIKLN